MNRIPAICSSSFAPMVFQTGREDDQERMMFNAIDRLYFERRAYEERARAAAATDMCIVRTHRAMALEYDRRAKAVVLETAA